MTLKARLAGDEANQKVDPNLSGASAASEVGTHQIFTSGSYCGKGGIFDNRPSWKDHVARIKAASGYVPLGVDSETGLMRYAYNRERQAAARHWRSGGGLVLSWRLARAVSR